MAPHSRVVLFSGGGTAGHLAPGFALAEELAARGIRTRFATPGEPAEAPWFEGREAPLRIPAARLPGGLRRALVFPGRSLRGLLAARHLIRREGVGCVVALGGWPCAPAALAARLRKVPLVFLVPDHVPGTVVRRLAGWAARIYAVSLTAARALGAPPTVRVTGPLLRSGIRESSSVRDPAAFDLTPDRRTLFVTGGSLGARGLNERFLAGLEAALAAEPDRARRIQVLHSAGADVEVVAQHYGRLPIPSRVVRYVHDMGGAYATADLVLCRAGANTCAELAATGTPAVFVPYPHHPDRQQFANAEPLVTAGGGKLIEEADLTPERVRRDVLDLLEDRASLAAMRAALDARPGAGAAETADDLIRFLGWKDASAAGSGRPRD